VNQALLATSGVFGVTIIDSTGTEGPTEIEGELVSVQAVNGNFTYGAGCAVSNGDAPSANITLTQGNIHTIPFTKVVAGTGVAFCFHSQKD
jgi:hypothetical protein